MRVMRERRGEATASSGRSPQILAVITCGMIALDAVLIAGHYAWQAWAIWALRLEPDANRLCG